MGTKIADELYQLSQTKHYSRFTELLTDLDKNTSLDTRQLDILIKIDFFSEFGNQRELLHIVDMFYNTFKKGSAKQISKNKVEGSPLEEIIKKYAVGTTKSGEQAKSYTLLDVTSIMREAEDAVKQAGIIDFDDLTKARNVQEALGYLGYASGKEEDRRKLYVIEERPLFRKKDGVQFGHSIKTKSIGSGKESYFTVLNRYYKPKPIHKDDIIYCRTFEREGQYFQLTGYDIISRS